MLALVETVNVSRLVKVADDEATLVAVMLSVSYVPDAALEDTVPPMTTPNDWPG